MSKSIWCVITEDDCSFKNISLGCYRSEEEAKKALAYWDELTVRQQLKINRNKCDF